MSELDSSLLKHWEFVADLGTWLVIIGVAGEGIEIALKILEHRCSNIRFLDWFKKHEFSIEVWGAIFWLMVVVGLLMELKGSHKSKEITDKENTRLTSLAAETSIRAGNAEKEAGESKLLAAQIGTTNLVLAKEVLEIAKKLQETTQIAIDARESVGDSNTVARLNETKATLSKAEVIAIETAKAQEQVTRRGGKIDRGFTPEQFAYGTNFLSRFSNTRINMNTLFGDGECSDFREKLFSLLKSAGWEPHIGSSEGIISKTGEPLPRGFEIGVYNKDNLAAAAALSTFLDGCGIKSFLDAKNMKEGLDGGIGSFVWGQ